MDKKAIRHKIKALKATLSDTDKAAAEDFVFAKINEMKLFASAKHILFYNSLPDELSTKNAIAQLSKTKNIYLPRVNGLDLEILPFRQMKVAKGAYNIEEPLGTDICDIDTIDIIIVPAIAYDYSGNRVGRGKGYYDRLLAKASAIKIGVGYDFQLLDSIGVEPHDIKVDIVVTPNHIITANPSFIKL